jgi:hypothetical protein
MTSADERELRRMADDIVGAQARHRRRTRWAVLAGAAVALAVAVPVVVVVSHPVTAGHPVAADRRKTMVPPSPPSRLTPTGKRQTVSDEARIYAAVIGGGRSGADRKSKPIYVMDRFCTGLMDLHSAGRGPCRPGPIPIEMQRQIRSISGAAVRFTASAPQPSLAAPVVTIGTATIDGDRAQVTVDMECGPLCGQGETSILTRYGDEWRVTGSTGPAWIS